MAGALRALGRARVAVVLSSVVAASASARGPDVSAIQRWLAAAHRSPSLRQRLSTIYTAVVVLAIGGVVVYGTASSALAQVVSADAVARWGPSLMLLALLGAAHWGTVQGPVVFSMADVAHLLGAPLPRAPLVARPLRRAFAFGFSGGVLVAVVLLVGLTGDHRHVAVARMVGGRGWARAVGRDRGGARVDGVCLWAGRARAAAGYVAGGGSRGGAGCWRGARRCFGADGGPVVGAVGVGGPGGRGCLVWGRVGCRVGRACVVCVCGRGVCVESAGVGRVGAVRTAGRRADTATGLADVVRRADQPAGVSFGRAPRGCERSRGRSTAVAPAAVFCGCAVARRAPRGGVGCRVARCPRVD